MIKYIIGDRMRQMNTFNLEPSKEEVQAEDYNKDMSVPSIGDPSLGGGYNDGFYNSGMEKKSLFSKKVLLIAGGALLALIIILVIVLSIKNNPQKRITPSLQVSKIEIDKGNQSEIRANISDDLYRQLTWKSSDEKIATVKGGTVTGIEIGTAQITATLPSGAYEVVEVTIKSNVPEFGIGDGNITLNGGETKTLNLQGALVSEVTWTSSSPLVASVTTGTVTAINTGTTTIVATASDGRVSKILVTVKGPHPAPQAIMIGEIPYLTIGQSHKLVITTKPEDASRVFTYSSSNPRVAVVDANGVVRLIGEGEASIRVTSYNAVVAAVKISSY